MVVEMILEGNRLELSLHIPFEYLTRVTEKVSEKPQRGRPLRLFLGPSYGRSVFNWIYLHVLT